MKKYRVSFPWIVHVEIEIEAEDDIEAFDIASENVCLKSLVGKGGYNKIVGTLDQNTSVYPNDDYTEGEVDLKCNIEEI